jgi:hypothetical protein
MRKLVSIVLSIAILVCSGVTYASVVGDLLKVGIDAQSNNITITNPKNLKVGNGTPNITLNGEDMYVEGTLEVDGAARFDGATTIAGNAGSDMLTVSAGNVQVTSGSIDVDNGAITVDTAQDLASNITRNFNGAGTGPVLTVKDDHTSSTNTALAVVQDGTGASTGVSITHSGDNPALSITAGAARTGDVISIAMADQLDQRALNITGAMTSAAGAGVVEVHATGQIAATGSLLRLDYDTAQMAAGDGALLNIADDSLAAAGTQYAVLINSANNEALHVQTGKSLFAELATFTSGTQSNGSVLADFDANTELFDITTSVTDYAADSAVATIYASGAGATNNTYLLRLRHNADGDAQDHFIVAEDNNGDDQFKVNSGGVVVANGGVSPGPQNDSFIYVASVEITNSQLKDLVANPKTLVAAPGADKFIELINAVLILDYGSEVLTVNAGDDLVIEYATSGQDATASIETNGFITAAADTMAFIPAASIATVPAANVVNKALQLFNTGVDFGGNASNDTTMTVKVSYRIHTAGL